MTRLWLFAVAAAAAPISASASCGSAFCTTNTNWDVHGAWTEPGARLDLRYEYINQNQPMAGSRKISVGEIPRHHDEVYTKNRNWLGALDYTFNQDWGVNALVPVVDREHLHIHNHMGAQLPEHWDFTQVGDVRVLARRRLATYETPDPTIGTLGLNFGVKLPTGRTDVRNAEGEPAERTLQPGSGTTDLLAGVYYSKHLPMKDMSWFVQGLIQMPVNQHQGYRPGSRLSFDAGARYALGERLGLMLQANALFRKRDRGVEAEPEDSGGKALFLSPGLSYAVTPGLQLYGFLQAPLYQYVNGVQLTAKHAVVVGLSTRF